MKISCEYCKEEDLQILFTLKYRVCNVLIFKSELSGADLMQFCSAMQYRGITIEHFSYFQNKLDVVLEVNATVGSAKRISQMLAF